MSDNHPNIEVLLSLMLDAPSIFFVRHVIQVILESASS